MLSKRYPKSWAHVVLGIIGLVLVYVFQSYLNLYGAVFQNGNWEIEYTGTDYIEESKRLEFILNKVFRYLLNDIFSILIIHGFLLKKSYTSFAFVLMAFGLVVLLPLYFYIYLSAVPGFSSMISHMHRIVLNPVLMMLLLPALWYQEQLSDKESNDRTQRNT